MRKMLFPRTQSLEIKYFMYMELITREVYTSFYKKRWLGLFRKCLDYDTRLRN